MTLGCYKLGLAQQIRRWTGENTFIDGQEPTPRSLNCPMSRVRRHPKLACQDHYDSPILRAVYGRITISVSRSNLLTRPPSWNQDPDIGVLKNPIGTSSGAPQGIWLNLHSGERIREDPQKGEMGMPSMLSSRWHCRPQTFSDTKGGLKNLKKVNPNGRTL